MQNLNILGQTIHLACLKGAYNTLCPGASEFLIRPCTSPRTSLIFKPWLRPCAYDSLYISGSIPLVKLYLKSLRSALIDNIFGKCSPGMMRNGDSKALFFGQNHGERSRIGPSYAPKLFTMQQNI